MIRSSYSIRYNISIQRSFFFQQIIFPIPLCPTLKYYFIYSSIIFNIACYCIPVFRYITSSNIRDYWGCRIFLRPKSNKITIISFRSSINVISHIIYCIWFQKGLVITNIIIQIRPRPFNICNCLNSCIFFII